MYKIFQPARRLSLFFSFIFLFCFVSQVNGQATTAYTDAWRTYKKAEADFQDNLLAKAQREYGEVIEMVLPLQQPEALLLRQKAELMQAKIAVRLGKVDTTVFPLNCSPLSNARS